MITVTEQKPWEEIARSLGELLSYPEEKIKALLKSNSKTIRDEYLLDIE